MAEELACGKLVIYPPAWPVDLPAGRQVIFSEKSQIAQSALPFKRKVRSQIVLTLWRNREAFAYLDCKAIGNLRVPRDRFHLAGQRIGPQGMGMSFLFQPSIRIAASV